MPEVSGKKMLIYTKSLNEVGIAFTFNLAETLQVKTKLPNRHVAHTMLFLLEAATTTNSYRIHSKSLRWHSQTCKVVFIIVVALRFNFHSKTSFFHLSLIKGWVQRKRVLVESFGVLMILALFLLTVYAFLDD